MTEATELFKYLRDFGILGFVFFAGWASYKRKWMWTSEHEAWKANAELRLKERDDLIAKVEKDRDFYKEGFLQSLGMLKDGYTVLVKRNAAHEAP